MRQKSDKKWKKSDKKVSIERYICEKEDKKDWEVSKYFYNFIIKIKELQGTLKNDEKVLVLEWGKIYEL